MKTVKNKPFSRHWKNGPGEPKQIDYIAGSFTGKNVKVLESQATALNQKRTKYIKKQDLTPKRTLRGYHGIGELMGGLNYV